MVDIVSSVPQQVEKTEITPLDNTIKRSKVLHAIAALEKNKIPASNDAIIRQINDPSLTRKEVLETISQLYVDGAIKKSKGNFKVTKPRKKRVIESVLESSTIAEPLPTLVPPVIPVPPIIPLQHPTTAVTSIQSAVPTPVTPATPPSPAGVTIPHDGLPTISSVHSYQAGKTMSFPVGKVDGTEKVRYVHPWQILPRYIQPSGKVVYQPGMPSRFVHPAQMIPIHIPHGAAMPEPPPGIPAFPPAYYPFVPGQPDGKPVQWVFYPVSIPVNAVRPFVKENSPKTNEEETTDPSLAKIKSPENITNDMIDNVPAMESETTKVKALSDIHPRNSLKLAQPCTDKAKYIAEDFNKASSLLRDQGPIRNSTMTSPKGNGSPTSFSTTDGKDNLTEEMNRLSAKHPREALLAKKRKQLLGIVDRVTEVAASKQNIEEQKKSLSNAANVMQPSIVPTLEMTVNNEPTPEPVKYIYTPINDNTVGKQSLQAFHPRFSLLPKSKETDEEKGQRLKEFSSLDNVRNILKAPPDFITNPVHPAPPTVSTKTNISTEHPVFIHPRKILYNNETPPIIRKTPEPNAFEQKIITEVNNSIKSLHSLNTKNRNSPIAQVNNTNDSNDIFWELERKAILEAKEFSKRINENVEPYQTNNPNIQSITSRNSLERHRTDELMNVANPLHTSCDTLDSESEEYHALKEISILQSANNPIIQSVTGTLTTYAPSILNVTPTIGTPHIRGITDGDNLCTIAKSHEHIHDSHNTESDCEIISDQSEDEVYNDDDDDDDDGDYDHNDAEEEEEDDDDGDYERLHDLINSSNCSNEDLKNLYIFNPNLILEDVQQVEKYKHLIPPMESDSDEDNDDDDDDDGDNNDDVDNDDGENNSEVVSDQHSPSPDEKLKDYPIRNKKIDPIEIEDEPSARRKNGEKYKALPLRTDREKRRRVDVFYKVTRTNFMSPPQAKKTRRNLRRK